MKKNYCEKCEQVTNHQILFEKKIGSSHEEDFHWHEYYQTIQCMGCDNIQFRKIYSDETMSYYDENGDDYGHYDETNCYPLYLQKHKLLPHSYWLPPKIKTIYLETINAFKIKSYLLAGAGFRAIIEAICIVENIKGRNLEIKINNLLKEKLITEKEANRLHSIRFLGNDTIHEMLVPEPGKLYIVLNIIENLLNNLYLIDKNSVSHLEIVISNYNNFVETLWQKVFILNDGDEKTVTELLGKDIRRIDKIKLTELTTQLISDIEESKLTWLVINNKLIGDKALQSQKFVIKK